MQDTTVALENPPPEDVGPDPEQEESGELPPPPPVHLQSHEPDPEQPENASPPSAHLIPPDQSPPMGVIDDDNHVPPLPPPPVPAPYEQQDALAEAPYSQSLPSHLSPTESLPPPPPPPVYQQQQPAPPPPVHYPRQQHPPPPPPTHHHHRPLSKKMQRDPGAPKRNMSAYLLYQNAMREQFKAINPGMTFGQLAKYTSAMYSELAPAEKEAWVARAESDKARYLHELASYVPPPGYDPKGDAIMSPDGMKSGRRGKPEKDVNAPKRNMSAYLLYQNAMRNQFKRENPGMTFGQLAKYTSHMYRNLTPEEKATWEARAAQDKVRYDAEIAMYVPPPGHDARGMLIEDYRPKKRSKRGPKDPAAPKRASGAYVFFTNEMRPKVLSEFPGIKFVELGKVMGERWRALTPEQKKKFEHEAAADKVRFQHEMQQYTANQAAQLQQQAPPPPPLPVPPENYYHDPAAPAPAYHYPDPATQPPPHDPYAHHIQYHTA